MLHMQRSMRTAASLIQRCCLRPSAVLKVCVGVEHCEGLIPWQLHSLPVPCDRRAPHSVPVRVCVNFRWQGEWGRLLWAPFLHASDLHLYYNMSSLLWKVGVWWKGGETWWEERGTPGRGVLVSCTVRALEFLPGGWDGSDMTAIWRGALLTIVVRW